MLEMISHPLAWKTLTWPRDCCAISAFYH